MQLQNQYRQVCARTPGLPVFAKDWWLDAVCPQWSAAIARKGDQVTGLWPYCLQQRLALRLMRNPLLTPYAGPVVCYPNDIKPANRDGFEHDTIVALAAQLPAAKVWHLAGYPGHRQAGIYKSMGLQTCVQQTFLLQLGLGEAALLSNMKESLRRNIRAANKEITITNEPAALATLFRYQGQTLSGKGVQQAYTLPQMQQLMDACLQHNSAALWVARTGSEVQALVWNVWDEQGSYYFMGAQKPEGDSYRAMSALLWHAIKESIIRGNEFFDLEGSMDPGVERFFRSFGGRRELYMVLRKNESRLWKIKQLFKP